MLPQNTNDLPIQQLDAGDIEWEPMDLGDDVTQAIGTLSRSTQAVCTSSASVPRLVNIQELLTDHSHLSSCQHSSRGRVGGTQSGGPAAASISLLCSPTSTEELVARQVAQSQVDPWQVSAFREACSKFASPSFAQPRHPPTGDPHHVTARELSQAELTQRLLDGRLSLSVQTAEHESRLLVESGTWRDPSDGRERTYPACMLGDNCIGNQSDFFLCNQTRRITWTAMMFEAEWRNFQSTSVYTGPPRMCVLDHRKQLPEIILLRRLLKMHPSRGDSMGCVDEPKLLQTYSNLVDQVGGYFRKYVILPEPGDPMIQPIVSLCASTLKVVPVSGSSASQRHQLRVDQSQLIFQSAPL